MSCVDGMWRFDKKGRLAVKGAPMTILSSGILVVLYKAETFGSWGLSVA